MGTPVGRRAVVVGKASMEHRGGLAVSERMTRWRHGWGAWVLPCENRSCQTNL